MEPSPLRELVVRVLVSHGFGCKLLAAASLRDGSLVADAYAAVVTTPSTLRRFRGAGDERSNPCPLIAVLNHALRDQDRPILVAADAFVLPDRVADLLPSIVALSGDGLSVMPGDALIAKPRRRLGRGVHMAGGHSRAGRHSAFRRGAELNIVDLGSGAPRQRRIEYVADPVIAEAGFGSEKHVGNQVTVPESSLRSL